MCKCVLRSSHTNTVSVQFATQSSYEGLRERSETGHYKMRSNAELAQIYQSPDIIQEIKSSRLRWAEKKDYWEDPGSDGEITGSGYPWCRSARMEGGDPRPLQVEADDPPWVVVLRSSSTYTCVNTKRV